MEPRQAARRRWNDFLNDRYGNCVVNFDEDDVIDFLFLDNEKLRQFEIAVRDAACNSTDPATGALAVVDAIDRLDCAAKKKEG